MDLFDSEWIANQSGRITVGCADQADFQVLLLRNGRDRIESPFNNVT
jgi:hypothetical protein